MSAIVPRHIAEAAKAEVRLVGERGRLERMTGPLRPEMLRGDRAKLGIDQRQEPLERTVVPLLPGPEDLGDIRFVVDGKILHRGALGVMALQRFL